MLPAPPAKIAVRFVLVPLVIVMTFVPDAVRNPLIVGDPVTATDTGAVTLVPAALVTVSVYVVDAVSAPVEAVTPLVTAPMPWLMVAVPPAKTAVRIAPLPLVTVACAVVKLVMDGAATTVTGTVAVTLVPAVLVTVSVNVVDAVSAPVETDPPLITVPRPWSIVAVPPVNVAARFVVDPLVIVGCVALNPVMLGAATTATETVLVTLVPAAFVTVRVNVVADVRAPVEMATPLVTGPTP